MDNNSYDKKNKQTFPSEQWRSEYKYSLRYPQNIKQSFLNFLLNIFRVTKFNLYSPPNKLIEFFRQFFFTLLGALKSVEYHFKRIGSRLWAKYILFTQPLRSDRIWHKVNFKRSLTSLNSEFSFS